jgi:5-methylthioadenosine/S-adenosylhomocysteine deaminase
MTYDTIIHSGTVVTVNEAFDILPNGRVCLSNGRIESVESTLPGGVLPDAQQMIDARGGIIMPGLVNTHTHAAMVLFRGLADDLSLMTWLKDYIFKAESLWLDERRVRTACRLSFADMLLSGTTTCCDGYFFEHAVAQAAQESGIRAMLAQGIVDFPAPGIPDPRENVDRAKDFVHRWQGKTPLIRPGLFCHSPYTCGEKTLRAAREVADQAGCLLQIHVAETKDEVDAMRRDKGISPFEYLESIGVLTDKTLVVHGVWATEGDMIRMARQRVGVSVATESEMKLASGVAPVPQFLEAGLAVGLGTDGCASNNNQDMFQEMDFVAKLHKVCSLDPTSMDSRTVLRLATQGGADAIGMGDDIGSIEVGKRGDLIVIDTSKPRWTPVYDPCSHLVYVADGLDVRDVLVDGKPVVEQGVLLTMDLDDVIATVEEAVNPIRSWIEETSGMRHR